MLSITFVAVALAAGLFGVLLAAPEIGFRLGRRNSTRTGHRSEQLGVIQTALLGLLALILGFSFSAAAARFIERQEIIVREANAIGTAYLRADLLPESRRGEYRALLRQYAESRVRLFEAVIPSEFEAAQAQSEALHPQLWSAAMKGIDLSQHVHVTVLPPLNEVIDLHTARLTVMRRHLPLPIVIVLLGLAATSLTIIGFGNGLSRDRLPVLTFGLAFVVATVLWVTIDLDFPRVGILRIDQRPMIDLAATLDSR